MKRILITLLLFFSSCSLIQQRINIANCKFSLKSASLKDVSLTGFTMTVFLDAYNPNDIEAVLDRLSGDLKLDDFKIATVSNSYKRVIKPKSSATVPIDISVSFSTLGKAVEPVKNAIQRRRGTISFSGKAYVDYNVPLIGKKTFSYPVDVSKNLTF